MSVTQKLISAVEDKNTDKVFDLVEKICASENAGEDGSTALHTACGAFNDEAVDILLSKSSIDVNVKGISGCTPLHKASVVNNVYAFSKISANPQVDMNVKADDGSTPLLLACFMNHLQIVSELVANPHVDINLENNNGQTPLRLACLNNRHKIVTKLLARPDLEVNEKSKVPPCPTPVIISALYCHEETLKLLLDDPRVNLDTRCEDGMILDDLVGILVNKEDQKEKCLKMIKEERIKREQWITKDGNIICTKDNSDSVNSTKNECPVTTDKPTVKLALMVFDATAMGKGRKTLRLNSATPMKEIKKLFPKHLGLDEYEFGMCVEEGGFLREVKDETPLQLFGSNLEGDDNVIKIITRKLKLKVKELVRPEEGLAKELKVLQNIDKSEQAKSADEENGENTQASAQKMESEVYVDRSEENVERAVSMDMLGKEQDHLPCSNDEDGKHEIHEVNKEKKKLKDKGKKPKCARASCRNRGGHRCSRCKAVYYCQQDCLTGDWPHHKVYCDYVHEANKDYEDSANEDTEGGTVEEVD